MDKYTEVQSRNDEKISENEIRITPQTPMKNCITYAVNKFNENKGAEVVLRAMGRAINNTVTIAEILKRRIPGLHQITKIDSTDIKSVWEPLEEGLDRVETTRHVSSIMITLSQTPLDPKNPGYQPPIPENQMRPGPTGPVRSNISNDSGLEPMEGAFRGRGRGRSGRGRGRGRGGPRTSVFVAQGQGGAPFDRGGPPPQHLQQNPQQGGGDPFDSSPPRGRGGFRSRGGGFRGGRGTGGFRSFRGRGGMSGGMSGGPPPSDQQ